MNNAPFVRPALDNLSCDASRMTTSAFENFTTEIKRCSFGRSARSTIIVGDAPSRRAVFRKLQDAASAIVPTSLQLRPEPPGNHPEFISARALYELVDQSHASTALPTLITCRSLDRLPDAHLGWVLDALSLVGRKRLRLMLLGASSTRIYRRCGNLRPSSEMLLQFPRSEVLSGELFQTTRCLSSARAASPTTS